MYSNQLIIRAEIYFAESVDRHRHDYYRNCMAQCGSPGDVGRDYQTLRTFILKQPLQSQVAVSFRQPNVVISTTSLVTAEFFTTDCHALEHVNCSGIKCLLPKSLQVKTPPKSNIALNVSKGYHHRTHIRLGVYNMAECPTAWTFFRPVVYMLGLAIKRFGNITCIEYPRDVLLRSALVGDLDLVADAIRPFFDSPLAYLYPHDQDDLCMIVRKIEPEQQRFLRALENQTWAVMLVSLLLFSFVKRLASRRYFPLETIRTFIWGDFSLDPFRPVANFVSLLLCVFGLLMGTAFCARFMSFLAVSKEAVQPQGLQEVVGRLKRLYVPHGFKREHVYFQDDDPISRVIKMGQDGYSAALVAEDLATSLEAAMIDTRNSFDVYKMDPRWKDTEGRSVVHLVPQCVLSPVYWAFPVHKHWPLRENVSSSLQRMVESGIPVNLLRRLHTLLRVYHNFTPSAAPAEEPRALGLGAVVQQLVVLAGGTTAAVLTFAAEMATRLRPRPPLRATPPAHAK